MRFYYLTTGAIYPHDSHLIEGLQELGHQVVEINEPLGKGALRRIARKLRKKLKEDRHDQMQAQTQTQTEVRLKKTQHTGSENLDTEKSAIIAGFTSPFFVFAAKLATLGSFDFQTMRTEVIFNATSSQYEGNIISRGVDGAYSMKAAKWWLIDFFTFHMADKTLLESKAQINFIKKIFLVSQKKLIKSFSGINEKEFYFDPAIQKKDQFTVLFRGRFLPESGILTVIEAAKKLENTDIHFRIIGHGFLYREVNALLEKLKPKNVEMITEKIPIDELRRSMLECHISLGQLARHPRLERTLPCKLFESLALKLPYVTGRNKAALEILEDGKTCVTVNPGDADDLAKKILDLKNDPKKVARIAEAGFGLYKEKLTSKKLAEDVLKSCFT
jgi:glycosyltransferase involved in cell wall biosynthesis